MLSIQKIQTNIAFRLGWDELVVKPAKIGGLDVAFIMPGADMCFVGGDSIELIVA
ncbi:hypothetical protein [Burkholderia ubonensis]|uniref:hypothetical protein n=1 Tax=Burkholderia ubonensis TaxID=101571 RepID=UPI0012FB4422|nr:hypothetical protein [Burkholderia ubonensis]